MASHKKQKSILDFFKRNTPTVLVGDDKSASDACNGIKRPLDSGEVELREAKRKTLEPLQIEVSFVDDDLVDISFEEKDADYLKSAEDAEKEDLIKSNYTFVTFRSIIKTIIADDHYAYLFNEDDWKVIEEFTCLAGPIQLLYLRLYMRKRAWIRLSSIKYPEIDPECRHKKDLENLVDLQFLQNSSMFETIEEALRLMSVGELKDFLKSFNGFNMNAISAKSKIIPQFLEYVRTTRTITFQSSPTKQNIESDVLKRLKQYFTGKCFRINVEKSNLLDRIFLLYYSPGYLLEKIDKQNDFQWYRAAFGEYISNDSYSVWNTNKVMQIYESREEFIEFQNAFELLTRIMMLAGEKQHDIVATIHFLQAKLSFEHCFEKWHSKDLELDLFLRQFTATGMYLRALNECLASLEKVRNYQELVNLVQNSLLPQGIYGAKYRVHWYVRAALICQSHLKDAKLAQELCRLGLSDSFVRYGGRIELYSRLLKMDKSVKSEDLCIEYHNMSYQEKTIYADYRNITNDTERKNFFFFTHENGDEELLSVEEIVIRHYQEHGFPKGLHCESSVYRTLFALFFWDIIYSIDVQDAFRYYKQTLPLDLNFDSFYARRQESIDNRIVQIINLSEDELRQQLTDSWTTHCNYVSDLVNWDISMENLIEIAVCLTGKKLAQIFQALACDFRHLRKGFPDLIVWNEKTRKIKLIEVKGPHDRISSIQSIWLSNLNSFGIEAELCHVKPKSKQT